MTIIVGLIDKESNTIYMGADSAGVSGYSLQRRKDTKVFLNGDFIIGYTSSFRMGQLIRFKFNPAKKYDSMDVYEYMCTVFIDELRDTLKKGGFLEVNRNVEAGGVFLVGYAGRLFQVESDFQVGELIENYNTCGCGEALALGSLFSTSTFNMDARERVELALKSACEFNAGVCAPFSIESKKYDV